jgi:hypothetical protein
MKNSLEKNYKAWNSFVYFLHPNFMSCKRNYRITTEQIVQCRLHDLLRFMQANRYRQINANTFLV